MKWKTLIVGVLMAAVAVSFAGCGSSSEESFSGILTKAFQDSITVNDDGDAREFTTTDKTVYSLGQDESHMYLGDTVKIEYHTEGDQTIADEVIVENHEQIELKLEGKVSDLNDATFTLTTSSMTVTFNYDKDTEIEGDLTKADVVEVIYQGDLSEHPRAQNVKVLEEKKAEETYVAHGVVAEVHDSDILLSIDSASAHRFTINDETKIEGKIEVGDRAEVTFTGDIDKNAVAKKIVIYKKAKKTEYVINGTIENTSGTDFRLNTGNSRYTFLINKETRFSGKKFSKGMDATVTYTGKLQDEPLAIDVFCTKKKEQKPTTTTKATTKATETKTKKTETKPTETKKTETKPTETKKTETKPTETKKTDPTETKTEPTETQTEPTETQTEPTETQTEPTETQTEPTETEPTETEPTETEPTETEPTEPEEVLVDGEGVIKSWSGNSCSVEINGSTMTFDSSDASRAGYTPEAGDRVRVRYDKNSMKLMDIQLLEKAAPESAENGETEGGN